MNVLPSLRWCVLLGALVLCTLSQTWAQSEFPAQSTSTSPVWLTVYSSLDTAAARPLIEAFQQDNPDVAVRYLDLQSLDIYERVVEETDNQQLTADLVISSAMDLQMKLANDGYARRVRPVQGTRWPTWASWRETAYALTYEPAVIVYHKPSFDAADVPRSRDDLMALLSRDDDALFGRIATYDIERAGLGFLFMARDAEHHRDIWALVEKFGNTGIKLYSSSSAILERVANGRFAIGYNILGSYAEAWSLNNPELGVVLPEDYTVVMSRIALVPEAASQPELGRRLLAFLMSARGQGVMSEQSRLPALHPDITGPMTANGMREASGNQLRPISVSPGLLVYLDQVKRARFIQRWNDALTAD